MEVRSKHFRKRDAILDCIRATKVHPSAEWVYSQLKPEIPDLSLGTVYRNLSLFRQQGDIMCVGTVHGVDRFDGNTKPHVHFICTGCGAVLDLDEMTVLDALAQEAAKHTGGLIREYHLAFTGLCEACTQENKKNKKH